LAEPLAVDTNWLLDVALSRDGAATRLWTTARNQRVVLHVPSIALVEAVKVLDGWKKEWERFSPYLRQFSGLGQVDEILVQSASLSDRAARRVWQTLERVSSVSQLLELTSSSIGRAASLRDQLNLSAADAAILSLVVEAHEQGACHDFLSRDAAFIRQDSAAYMRSIGVTLWRSAATYLASRPP
jgi:predicted nucleic acid-binding protein